MNRPINLGIGSIGFKILLAQWPSIVYGQILSEGMTVEDVTVIKIGGRRRQQSDGEAGRLTKILNGQLYANVRLLQYKTDCYSITRSLQYTSKLQLCANCLNFAKTRVIVTMAAKQNVASITLKVSLFSNAPSILFYKAHNIQTLTSLINNFKKI